VILSGTLHVVSDASGRQMLLATLKEGDSLGEVGLFDAGPASATAIMRGDGLVWALSREEFDSFVEADPAAGAAALKGLLSQLASRLRSMNSKLATAEQRAAFHQFWTASHP
jgi:CRP/FNR family transcriptional regulator